VLISKQSKADVANSSTSGVRTKSHRELGQALQLLRLHFLRFSKSFNNIFEHFVQCVKCLTRNLCGGA